jgi:glutathione synthase
MKIAFVTDPLEEFKTYKDTTYAIMRECAARGHQLFVMQQDDLLWKGRIVQGNASPMTFRGGDADWYSLGEPAAVPLETFDIVMMRKDPPFDMEYVYSTYLLEMAEGQGARVVNRPRAIRDYNEKMAIARFAGFTAPTVVTRKEGVIREFLAEHGDIVMKPLDGMGGTSVFRVRAGDPNTSVIMETLTHYGRRTIMVQRYLPEIVDGDKRVLIIGGKPVPFALARVPQPGETRGNLAAGGTGIARPLTARDREIAESLGPRLLADGLLLVGLDVIGSHLTEVNVTSPTCFQEIMQQTGCNVAGMMVDTLEEHARS